MKMNWFTCLLLPKKELKDYIEILEKRYAYLRENFELEVEKRVNAYQKDAHPDLVKEVNFWMEQTDKLRKYINQQEDDGA